MKKVHHNILLCEENVTQSIYSLHMLPWNRMLRLMLSLLLASVNIDLINLYLLIRVQLTVRQHTIDMLGL